MEIDEQFSCGDGLNKRWKYVKGIAERSGPMADSDFEANANVSLTLLRYYEAELRFPSESFI